jgi:hypothetical protein
MLKTLLGILLSTACEVELSSFINRKAFPFIIIQAKKSNYFPMSKGNVAKLRFKTRCVSVSPDFHILSYE